MGFLSFFLGEKKNTASVAKERLQIILAHERTGRGTPEYLPQLKEEILRVIAKYVAVDGEKIAMSLEKHDDYDLLELNIMLPDKQRPI